MTYNPRPFRRKNRGSRSIKRNGSNEQYKAQDLPYATFPSEAGVVFRAGTEVGGQRCPRCRTFIAVTSRVVRLEKPERLRHQNPSRRLKKWWVHEQCWNKGAKRG